MRKKSCTTGCAHGAAHTPGRHDAKTKNPSCHAIQAVPPTRSCPMLFQPGIATPRQLKNSAKSGSSALFAMVYSYILSSIFQSENGGDSAVSSWASQPIPCAIDRLATATSALTNHGCETPITSPGLATMPHQYRWSWSLHRSAIHAPERRLETSTPKGHGSVKQHRPQPLQGAPKAGLAGAPG